MRTTLISDIHGNYAALLAALADVECEQCDRILCLGDLVDGGMQSIEVVRLIQSRNIPTIQGNHDEFPNTPLPPEITGILQSLPTEIVEGGILYTHTSPREKKRKISNAIEAWNVFDEAPQYRRIFVGDVHVPLIYGERSSEPGTAMSYDIPYDEPLQFAADDRYIVCVGAVGYSRDRYDWIRYAIYDDLHDTITFKAPAETNMRF